LALTPLTALGRAEGSIQKTWDYPEGIHTLVVDTDGQDVVLRAGGPGLTGRLVGASSDDVRAVKTGDTLTITVRSDKGWFSWRKKTSRVEFSLPTDLNLDVTTASGAVVVQVASASLKVRTASGDIEAARGGASVDADSTSGTVRLKAFTGPVRASALSGDLVLEDLAGDIQASTLSGDLSGTGLDPADKSRFTTVTGSARLGLKGGLDGFTIRSETVSGEVKVGDESANRELTVGKSGPVIFVKSVSGDVRVK
jgi:DUF4097 and DUF4098 domain-containing protein YvlB